MHGRHAISGNCANEEKGRHIEVRFADEEKGRHGKKLGETRISRVVSETSRLERNSQKNVATS